MLVYLATYPRCGAAFLRETLFRNWRYLSADVYEPISAPEKHNIRETGDPDLLSYGGTSGFGRPLIRSPCLERLTPALRRRLAVDLNPIFVKTHEPPPAAWLRGECAVQMVRHPAAAISSYRDLLGSIRGVTPTVSDVSNGRYTGGGWGTYHDAWVGCGIPTLRIRYEDAVEDPKMLVVSIARFLELPRPTSVDVPTIEYARNRDPRRNPGKGISGWKDSITAAELESLWAAHGQVAERLGYNRDGHLSVN